jgi:hypothetical protein
LLLGIRSKPGHLHRGVEAAGGVRRSVSRLRRVPNKGEHQMREKIGKQMLQTSVRKIEYDFMACTGKLFQDFGYCDMSECIAYFEKIDPAVIRIQTYCGGEKDTYYFRSGGK